MPKLFQVEEHVFSSPLEDMGPVCWDGTDWRIAEYQSERIHRVDTNFNLLDFIDVDCGDYIGGDEIGGLTRQGDYLWIASAWSKIIIKVEFDGTLVDTYASPNDEMCWGITFDGTNLWVINESTGLYKLSLICEIEQTLASGVDAGRWSELAYDGTRLWLNQYLATDEYRRLTIDGGTVTNVIYNTNDSRNAPGIEWVGSRFWATDWGYGKFTAYSVLGGDIAMSTDAMGTTWYAWLEGDDLKVNRLISETPTAGAAVTVDSSGDYDAVADVQFNGPFIRVIVRKASDEKPYCFQSTDMGNNWTGPTDIS